MGNSFVKEYYLGLTRNPQSMRLFYENHSVLTHADPSSKRPASVKAADPAASAGVVETVEGQMEIHNKVMQLGCDGARAEITSVDSQLSLEGGVIVQVTGSLSKQGSDKRNFVQTFFLAAHERGYYVRNDIFRYIDNVGSADKAGSDAVAESRAEVGAPMRTPSDVGSAAAPATDGGDGFATSSGGGPGADGGKGKRIEDDVVQKSENETNGRGAGALKATASGRADGKPKENVDMKNRGPVNSSSAKEAEVEGDDGEDDGAPKTYASMVKKLRSQAAAAAAAANVGSDPTALGGGAGAPSASKLSPALNTSIFVRNLPSSIDEAKIESVFSRFGPVKGGASGISLKIQKSGCYAFIEFEEASSVAEAISACASEPIEVGGNTVSVEEKKPMVSKEKGEKTSKRERRERPVRGGGGGTWERGRRSERSERGAGPERHIGTSRRGGAASGGNGGGRPLS